MHFLRFGNSCLRLAISLTNDSVAFTLEVGGANLINYHLVSRKVPFAVFAQGTSSELFNSLGINSITLPELTEVLPTLTEVYLALGNHPEVTSAWVELIRNARAPKLKVYGVLDNWVDYESRIGAFQVDEYVVFDSYAHQYVQAVVPNSQVSIFPNSYLSSLEKEVKSLRSLNSAILILGGRQNDYSFSNFNRLHMNQNCVCEQIARINRAFPNYLIILRLHPATQLPAECSESIFIRKMLLEESLEISDSFQSLGAALSRVSVVFGPHGYALFMSAQMGFETYSTTYTNVKWRGPQFSSFNFFEI